LLEMYENGSIRRMAALWYMPLGGLAGKLSNIRNGMLAYCNFMQNRYVTVFLLMEYAGGAS